MMKPPVGGGLSCVQWTLLQIKFQWTLGSQSFHGGECPCFKNEVSGRHRAGCVSSSSHNVVTAQLPTLSFLVPESLVSLEGEGVILFREVSPEWRYVPSGRKMRAKEGRSKSSGPGSFYLWGWWVEVFSSQQWEWKFVPQK